MLSLLEFLEGFESPLGASLLAILKNDWGLTNTETITLGSIYFLGKFFGAIFQSIVTDEIGRKKMIQIMSGMIFFTIMFTALA